MDKKKNWNIIKLFLKIVFTVAALWIVYNKVDLKTLSVIGQNANPWFLLPALTFFILSQTISCFRLLNFFRNISLPISAMQNFRLYLMGMFYNLFLPGGLGGDGYKVFILKKRFDTTHRKVFTAIFLDRTAGLWALGFIIAILATFIPLLQPYSYWAAPAYLASTYVYYLIIKRFFPQHERRFVKVHLMALAVQTCQMINAAFIIATLGIEDWYLPYLFIFMLSSLSTLFPFSVGGLGAREIVILWGATALGLDKDFSVSISLSFYFISAFVALSGIFILFDKKRFPAAVQPAKDQKEL